MKNFLMSAGIDIVFIFVSYFLFREIIRGPIRHKMYEKLFSSFAKFIITIFLLSIIITSAAAYILYKTRYLTYINIIASALVSILVGFLISLVPTRGVDDEKDKI
ncbi:hypothetical protein D4Z93_12570 [Clostridium fermenticellae]|uniref:Uncharacterized protein n=1 Tax=Clostridium fermenticellae TaxID=2068654 RepID=A0A386H701_9CLOT|nr:hypothetical protein [Clostridium fermenticellae]AYD41295.1 hypothetical protein D4Z93_12570 [Clostridium fermenticellae]